MEKCVPFPDPHLTHSKKGGLEGFSRENVLGSSGKDRPR